MRRADRERWPCRSELAVPGSEQRKIDKGLASDADLVFLDLEDAVFAEGKEAARGLVVAALRDGDWRDRPKTVRVNAIDSPHCYRDLIAVAELGDAGPDRVIVPKVRSIGDIAFLERLLTQVGRAVGRAEPIALEIQLEDAVGMTKAAEIAAASPRVETVTFGPGDFAASMGMPARAIGTRDEWDDHYGADRWHLARQTVVLAARAAGARALDGPYADFRDLDGFTAYCCRSRSLGFDGVWCIHPDQIAVANAAFMPSEEEVVAARYVIEALNAAASGGQGATAHGVTMLDAASERMARRVLDAAQGR